MESRGALLRLIYLSIDFRKDVNEKIEQEKLDKLDKEVLGKVQDKQKYGSDQMSEGIGNWIKEAQGLDKTGKNPSFGCLEAQELENPFCILNSSPIC